MKAKVINYEAIQGHKEGRICLQIYPPGTWMGSPYYHAFVGGCGVGQATSLKAAKSILIREAKGNLLRKIEDSEGQARHYRQKLLGFALKRKGAKP